MATTPNLEGLLESLGFDSNASYAVPEKPSDAALAGVRGFIHEHAEGEAPSSVGIIHITGSAVEGNSAPVKAVGTLLTSIQNAVDSIGAALMGNRSAGGQISAVVTDRTQLSLVANPMPGSVVIEIAPTLDRMKDLYPNGPSLFDVENDVGAKPLADLAVDEFSTLIALLNVDDIDNAQFVDHLTDLGPRVASCMKGFCESVDKGTLDVRFEWSEPCSQPKTVSLTHLQAERAVTAIDTANIDNEEITLEGTLLTITQSAKDRLRILDDNGKEIVISFGYIDPVSTYSLHTGQRVRLLVERRVSSCPGGKQNVKLVARSIQPVPALDD